MIRVIGRLICKAKGAHTNAEFREVVEGVLWQATCPRCGVFLLVTQTDFVNSIIEGLTKKGYADIEQITSLT